MPDSTDDAWKFERKAWEWAENGSYSIFNNFTGPSPDFISWLISIPYSLFGRSLMMAQSISLFFGIGSVFLCWLISKRLWNNHIANKVGWMTALFPSLILYSVLFLREVYIVFFILLALLGVIDWVKKENFKSFILALIGFVGATFFHGAMMIGGMTFVFIVGASNLIKSFKLIKIFKVNFSTFGFIILFTVIFGLYFTNKIKVPYLEDFSSTSDVSFLLEKTDLNTQGDAAWPEWTRINSPIELLYKVPIRAVYFMFAPFPWDVKKIKHLIGMIDGFLYMYLVFLIISNIKFILKDPALRVILIILISYILVFGVGVGNFGTSIRHRSKFAVFFILLAAQGLKKINILKKNFNTLH